MKSVFALLVCTVGAISCFGQLQMKPAGADTMSNEAIARWYTGRYESLLSLTPGQKKKVYQVILKNRSRHDSLLQIKNVRTEDLVRNTLALDEQMKSVLTDAQYSDYLRTAQLMEWHPKR